MPWLLLKTFFTLKVTWKVSVLGSTSPWDTTLASTMSGLICTNSLRLHWGHFGTWVKTGSKLGCFWANIGPKSIKSMKLWFIIPSLMDDTCRLLHEKIAQRSVLKRKISWTYDGRTNETNERSLVHDKSGWLIFINWRITSTKSEIKQDQQNQFINLCRKTEWKNSTIFCS